MVDIIVTTPKNSMKSAAGEAEKVKEEGGGLYFRTLTSHPRGLDKRSRVFYVEDGYVRGFCRISTMEHGGKTCELTDRSWTGIVSVIMDAGIGARVRWWFIDRVRRLKRWVSTLLS